MESGRKKTKAKQSTSQNKKSNTSRKKSGAFLNALKYFLIVMILASFVGAGTVYFYIMGVLKDVTPLNPVLIEAALTENSVIVDSEGRVLEKIQLDGLRTVIRYEDMSPELINAFIAVEDKTFFTHNGFNVIRMFGAVRDALTQGKRIGGTSTITQQLARNIFLSDIVSERSLDRKIKEAYYAVELEKYLKKEQILEAYLNFVNLGTNSYGVEAAAQTYFSKSASELDYIEAAMLAGVPKGPGIYAPLMTKNKEDVTADDYVYDDSDPLYTLVFNNRSMDRYLTAIYLQHENGYISDAQYAYAKSVDIRTLLVPNRNMQGEISSFFADMVKDAVINDFVNLYGYTEQEAINILNTGGLIIESTIDYDIQKTLESHYARDNFTSYFGESTAVAVRNFQKNNDISQTGTVGPETLDALTRLSSLKLSDLSLEGYKKGDDHEDVILIKNALYELNYLVNNENYPRVTVLLDAQGNILSDETRRILLYKKTNLIDEENHLVIPEADYYFDDSGNLVLLRNRRLNFYSHYSGDTLSHIQIVVRDTYEYNEVINNPNLASGRYSITDLFTYAGRDVLIDNAYKTFDADNNVVISKAFISENPDFFKMDSDKNILIHDKNYVISSIAVMQPQSAMVIIDYRTGELKAVVGGRNIVGQKMFNRAINPRQPGSAIKPISVYTPAIDSGKYTAGSVIDDRPVYLGEDSSVRWPVNWYETFRQNHNYWGLVTIREAIEQSINVTATLIGQDIGVQTSVDYLERFGITSLVKEGPVNDLNLSAMTLGGMSKGISPIELTAAYGALANGGVHVETIYYKTVKNRNGDILLDKTPKQTVVVDENVAYIMTDMLRTTVSNGLSSRAKLSPRNDLIPVAGKTGTTNSNMDAWFIGYTPYYVGGIWFGNDINIPLDQGSSISSQFWQAVMADVHTDYEPKSFEEPSGIVKLQIDRISGKLPSELSALDPRGTIRTEMFLRGTEPTEEDDVHVMLEICTESGLLAGEHCPVTLREMKLFVQRPVPYNPEDHMENGNPIFLRDSEYDAPTEYCDIHTESSENDDSDPNSPSNGSGQSYLGVRPMISLVDGSFIIQRPYPIELMDGQIIILPPSSRIQADDNVLLPDGSIIPSYSIRNIPMYTAEELDALNP